MNTAIRTTVRTVEPPTATRRGANARKRDESRFVRIAEVRREASTHAAGMAKKIAVATLVLVALAGTIFGGRELVLRQGWIALRDLEIKGISRTTATEIVNQSGAFRGQPLTSLDLGRVRERLASQPWIASATVVRVYPHRIRIAIVERIPALALPDGRWVGEDGRVMDARGVRSLPVVAGIVDDQHQVALKAMPMVRALARMEREAPSLLERTHDVRLESDGSLSLRLAGFSPLLRMQPGDWKKGLARAGALEKELTTEAAQIGEIDLRQGSCAALRRKEGGA